MTKITLTTDQLAAIQQATDTIELHDESGELVAYAALAAKPGQVSPDLLEAAKRLHSEGPWYTTEEVQNNLSELQQK